MGAVGDEVQTSRDGLSEQERRRTIELADSYRQLRSCCARGKEARRHDKGNDVQTSTPSPTKKPKIRGTDAPACSRGISSFLPFSSFFHLRLGPVPLVCCSKPDDYLTTRRRTTFAVFIIATLVASLSGTVLDGPLIHLQFRRPYNALSTFFNFPTMSGVVPFQNGQAAGLAVSAPLPLCTQPPDGTPS